MSLCLVSAFLDISRQNWADFSRSWNDYIEHFLPYLMIPCPMIVFMDDQHSERFRKICRTASHIKIIDINRDWMQANIYAYQQLPREREIMGSSVFQALVSDRLHYPECSQPEYTIMQHAKIDFVNYVIEHQLQPTAYYAWTDFGYFQDAKRIPRRPLDINKFDLTRVNFQAMAELEPQDFDITYTLTKAPLKVGGFFFLGSPEKLREYQQLYHTVCREFHERGIVDDDQHVMIQCVARNPELFKVWNLGAWHLVYVHFQV